mmetsp:Transcript_19610/g.63830  ORF Transcript_19610/g.63830 Transcript_19610/m.63830 type:complete len:282 (+) Transcript_19610:335-1180(+)|eukprot:scaffold15024_cov124-Isochrysis_galbana.AAC.4
MSAMVRLVGLHRTPSPDSISEASTSRCPMGTAPPSKRSSQRIFLRATACAPSCAVTSRRISLAGTRASQDTMKRLWAAAGRVAALMWAWATSRTSATRRDWMGASPSIHRRTICTEKASHDGERGGPKIMLGQRVTSSPPTSLLRAHARLSLSALENWYGSNPAPSRRETVFQSFDVYQLRPPVGAWPLPRTAAMELVRTSRAPAAAHAHTICSARAMLGATNSFSQSLHRRNTEAVWITASTPSAASRADTASLKSSHFITSTPVGSVQPERLRSTARTV